MARTGLLVPVPEADPWVESLMSKYIPATSRGIPAHITVLFPFVPLELVTEVTLKQLRTLFERIEPFEITLGEISRFPQTVYLKPEPTRPLIDLTRAVEREFPEYPPFGGVFPDLIPHLTVADGSSENADAAARELNDILTQLGPISARCASVDLYKESTDVWCHHASFQLGKDRRASV